jgi:hypothetical protein
MVLSKVICEKVKKEKMMTKQCATSRLHKASNSMANMRKQVTSSEGGGGVSTRTDVVGLRAARERDARRDTADLDL